MKNHLAAFLILCIFTLPLYGQDAADPANPPRTPSPGGITYLIDAAQGDDSNPAGKPWRSFSNLNKLQLAAGDTVEIEPGRYEGTLNPVAEGTAEQPVKIRFKPGTYTIGMEGIIRLPMYISNACDSPAPKPIGILVQNSKYLTFEGGGVEGAAKTMIVYDGRMVEIFNDHSKDITFTNLVFDLKRPTVSEFRAIQVGPTSAVIQVAEGSDYAIENQKFVWKGDWTPGNFCQQSTPADGRCWWCSTPRGWEPTGQVEAQATDLGDRKVQLDFGNDAPGLTEGHQYDFRNIKRDTVGVHNARCQNIVFQDCDFYALTGMGFVSQFTENITYERVNVAPPSDTIRTCPAWADIFQFSNCKGNILVDSCRLSGMEDDSINCHGTYLSIVDTVGDNQLLVRFIHPQTYGFAPFAPGDEVAVMNSDTLREYDGNPRCKVVAIEEKTAKDWLLTVDALPLNFKKGDLLDNITWNPDITITNNKIDMDPMCGFKLGTRGKIVVENNTIKSSGAGVRTEGDGKSWMESSPLRDMLIQNNHFIHCNISIGANIKNKLPDAPVHENVRILDNTFDDLNGPAVDISVTKGVTVSGNKSNKGAINVNADGSCSDVKVDQ
jgi:parallel beta helix pectate lyase-like protein